MPPVHQSSCDISTLNIPQSTIMELIRNSSHTRPGHVKSQSQSVDAEVSSFLQTHHRPPNFIRTERDGGFHGRVAAAMPHITMSQRVLLSNDSHVSIWPEEHYFLCTKHEDMDERVCCRRTQQSPDLPAETGCDRLIISTD